MFNQIRSLLQVDSCDELQNVKVPLSAIARCLTKYSSGTNPVLRIYDEGNIKKSQKRFFLRSKNIPEVTTVSESSLHPYLVKFAQDRFNVYCRTINALKNNPNFRIQKYCIIH